jgi:hypothetical protein
MAYESEMELEGELGGLSELEQQNPSGSSMS